MPRKKNIFVACSTSAEPLARALKAALENALKQAKADPKAASDLAQLDLDIREWYDLKFTSDGDNILSFLITQKQECDFAIVLLTKDDFGEKKGEIIDIPRDNTIFELGLFAGELGIRRCVLICAADPNALPSDLGGIKRIDIPQYLDLTSETGINKAVEIACAGILTRIKAIPCFEHPCLPIITRAELGGLERPKAEGGNLEIVQSDTAVIVNSVQPVEVSDSEFCQTVLNNLKKNAQYEYYYGELGKNIIRTANLVYNLATSGLQITDGTLTTQDLETIKKNLAVMQRNLSIHFRERVPMQFCVHNAGSVETAVCYLRCHGDYSRYFVRWADGDEAMQISEELRRSCKEMDKTSSIFHSTIDVELEKVRVMRAIADVFPSGLPSTFYQELSFRCVGT